MAGLRVAVIGATGAVGSVFLDMIEECDLPIASMRLCASERSWGRKISVNGNILVVENATPKLLTEVDLVFISATGDVSKTIAPVAVSNGAIVIDDSSSFRMDPNVPLVVPEVNADDLDIHSGIIAIPNCSTTPLVMALKPLDDVNPVVRVIVDTYQSVSGTGTAAMEELKVQTQQVISGEDVVAQQYPHRIAFNVLPHIDHFISNGYTNEEMKMVRETRKIMHRPQLPVSATCVRVPVMVGHSEAVHVEFQKSISASDVIKILSKAPGIEVIDDPNENKYPMPVDAAGNDSVFVGRIRQDVSCENGIVMWLVSDNLRKGAALNAIQIAKELNSRGLLQRSL